MRRKQPSVLFATIRYWRSASVTRARSRKRSYRRRRPLTTWPRKFAACVPSLTASRVLESASASARMFVEPLAPYHDRTAFSCGVPELDTYLKSRASQHVARRVANVFVLVPRMGDREIMGYYT